MNLADPHDQHSLPADERQQLARLGLRYADIIESNGATVGAGIVRRLAAAVLEAPHHADDGADAVPMQDGKPSECRRCGAALHQKPIGRPRMFCSERCRRGRWDGAPPLRPACAETGGN